MYEVCIVLMTWTAWSCLPPLWVKVGLVRRPSRSFGVAFYLCSASTSLKMLRKMFTW